MQQPPSAHFQTVQPKYLRLIQVFGILHIVNSVLILAFGIVVLAEFDLRTAINEHASSVWSAPFFMVTGILGIMIFCKPQNRALVISHSTFAIISCLFSTAILITSAFGIKYYNCKRHYYNYYSSYYSYSSSFFDPWDCRRSTIRDIGQPMYGMLVVLSTIELVFSIVSTIYSFRIFNCCINGCGDCGGDCGCGGCGNECQSCCEQQVQPSTQMYQMQPYPPNQRYYNNMAPQFQPQYLQPSYIQQIGNPQMAAPNMQQGQIVTSSSGQQFVLMPVSQIQTTSPVAAVATVASSASASFEQGTAQEKPPSYPA